MSEPEFVDLGPGDYDRAKAVFNKARHPGFIGRELFFRCATTGKACVAALEGVDSGVALVDGKSKLLALSVIKAAQGRGVGPALMHRLKPQWVSSIGERVGFFQRLGYEPVGAAEVGKNGKHSTQLMRLSDGGISGDASVRAAPAAATPTESEQPAAPSLVELARADAVTRVEGQIEILQAKLLEATGADTIKLLETFERLARRLDRMRES